MPPACGQVCSRISIHALPEEGDFYDAFVYLWIAIFLSTPSARRATWPVSKSKTAPTNFYPRPPRGGRPMWPWRRISMIRFLSTPSARRATADWLETTTHCAISIHALREEGDQK